MITSKAFEASSWGNRENIDYVWRIVLMFGAIPALHTYYWRMKMPETARYTALVAKDEETAALDMSTVLNMHIAQEEENVDELASMHYHGLHLLGTTMTWFVLDVTFYSLNMFMKEMFGKVKLVHNHDQACNPLVENCSMASPPMGPGYYHVFNPLKPMISITGLHTLIALLGTLPGYFFTVAFINVSAA